jgi:hypothetical protein
LLERIIERGEEVIKEMMVMLLVNSGRLKERMVLQHQFLDWLLRARKLMTLTIE